MKISNYAAQYFSGWPFWSVNPFLLLGLGLILSVFPFKPTLAQNCEAIPSEILTTAGQSLYADESFTDDNGWTHFYNCAENKLLLSIFTFGENIGTINDGLVVQSGTLDNFGTEGTDLSAASYITNELWFAANRHWSIQNLATEVDSLQIRFYIDSTDFQDLRNSFDDFGIEIFDFERLSFFSATGSLESAYALNLNPGENEAIIYEHEEELEERRDWIQGNFEDLYYGEFVVKNAFLGSFSEAVGTVGFLFFLPDVPLNISGQVLNPFNQAVEDAEVFCEADNSADSNNFGNYQCTNLEIGSDYTLRPEKLDGTDEHVTVLDINRLWSHVIDEMPFDSPFMLIAGDVDHDMNINNLDITATHRVILQRDLTFEHCPSWRFVPADYVFPNPLMPYQPPFPETITLENVLFDVFNQDFTGIKTGDVAFEDDYPNEPLQLVNPAFVLSDIMVACDEMEQITIEMMVEDFTNLSGFQFSLNWDTTALELVSIAPMNLPNLDNQNINKEQAANGWLGFAWTSWPGQMGGTTVSDGTTITEMVFQLKTTSSNTAISFSPNPIPIQILRQNWSVVENPILDASQITVESSSLSPIVENIQDLNCSGDANGAIDITINNGTPPYQYLWSNGAQTEDIQGLVGGNYSVTIDDANDCPKVISNIFVNEPAPLAANAQIQHPNCAGVSGSIELNTTGGTAPYQFLWSTGSTENQISDLTMGLYHLTLTDANDCILEESFAVGEGGVLTANASIQGVSSMDANDGQICITNLLFGTAPFSFQWSTGETTECAEDLGLGNYSVTVEDANGCRNEFAYEVDCCFVSIINKQAEDAGIYLYPNPVQKGDYFNLYFTKNISNLEIELWASNGQKLEHFNYKNVQAEDKVRFIAPEESGVYLIRSKTSEKIIFLKKLVVL